jgi:hypothetical protein
MRQGSRLRFAKRLIPPALLLRFWAAVAVGALIYLVERILVWLRREVTGRDSPAPSANDSNFASTATLQPEQRDGLRTRPAEALRHEELSDIARY